MVLFIFEGIDGVLHRDTVAYVHGRSSNSTTLPTLPTFSANERDASLKLFMVYRTTLRVTLFGSK